ncbi:agrin [Lingula anatina]|uniref:Agrin n=1 Tax=Lingula anatina TaxID=7574 RepID=A0A1S3KAV8_LINAN|nr:agrin [Lingula anatina]|eukprot:XP_013419396.1 agrin [Lingula anatina]
MNYFIAVVICICVTHITAQDVSKCDQVCTDSYKPVCASDGQTYDNDCELQISTCMFKILENKDVVKVSNGPCKGASPEPPKSTVPATKIPASTKTPSWGTTPKVQWTSPKPTGNELLAKCLSIDCMSIYSPICGTDGKTYSSHCHLAVQLCIGVAMGRFEKVSVAHRGICGTQSTTPTPIDCNNLTTCSSYYAPLCGSNGITYRNVCLYQQAYCQAKNAGTSLSLAGVGEC